MSLGVGGGLFATAEVHADSMPFSALAFSASRSRLAVDPEITVEFAATPWFRASHIGDFCPNKGHSK
jgi:hypothetical protein